MNISNLNSLPLSSTSGLAKQQSAGDADFGSLVKGAIESINNTQKGAEKEISQAVTGETEDLHKTIIALQTADLKFQLGIQVRNKFIGAYEEVMRMQI